MGTLRTWAAWTVGWMAEKAEDVADTLELVADFLEGNTYGIEVLRADWSGPFGDVAKQMLLDPWAVEGDTMKAVLVSNEEPHINRGLGDFLCAPRDDETQAAVDRTEERARLRIGWPEPAGYDEGNGHWYSDDPLSDAHDDRYIREHTDDGESGEGDAPT